MGLRLVWETGEWDPVPGLDDDDWGEEDVSAIRVALRTLAPFFFFSFSFFFEEPL